MGKGFAGGDFADVLRLRVLAEYALTDAETDVALRMLSGEKNRQIMRNRGTKLGTVKSQVSSVLRAAGVADRVEFSWAVHKRVAEMLGDDPHGLSESAERRA